MPHRFNSYMGAYNNYYIYTRSAIMMISSSYHHNIEVGNFGEHQIW